MSNTEQITVGMPVYGVDELPIGPVEELVGDGIQVGGQQIPGAVIAQVTEDSVHLKLAGGALLARHDRQTELPHVDSKTTAASPGEERPPGAAIDG